MLAYAQDTQAAGSWFLCQHRLVYTSAETLMSLTVEYWLA